MNKKELREKIIKLLNDDYVEDKIGEASPNISADAVGSIAEDIVNLLPIHDVSGLSDLKEWCFDNCNASNSDRLHEILDRLDKR